MTEPSADFGITVRKPGYIPRGSAVDSLMTVTATDELTDRTQGMRDR